MGCRRAGAEAFRRNFERLRTERPEHPLHNGSAFESLFHRTRCNMNILQLSIGRAVGTGALSLLVAASLFAQSQGPGAGPRYDPATEATVTGTVESVEQIPGPGGGRGRRGLGGTHLAFKTSTEALEVHLGPTTFLDEKNVAIAKGDTLVITGSRITVDGDRVFIAKEVKKGDSTWTLRDTAGLPLWRGRGRGQ
jgi:hypothetical protein